MRTLRALIVLFSIVFCENANSQCANLTEMVARINGLKPGSPLQVASVRGNAREGVVQGVFSSPDGRRVVNLRRPDGKVESIYIDQLDPSSFRAPLDNLQSGYQISIKKRKGKFFKKSQDKTFSGTYLGRQEVDGNSYIRIKNDKGVEELVPVVNLDESTLVAKAPAPVGQSHYRNPRKLRGNVQQYTPVKSVQNSYGNTIGTTDDNRYISYLAGGTGRRIPAKVIDAYTNLHGEQFVIVEKILSSGHTSKYTLSLSELNTARISNTSRSLFSSKPLSPVASPRAPPSRYVSSPVPVNAPSVPPTTSQRAIHVSEAFGSDAPALTADFSMKSIVNPHSTTGSRHNMLFTLEDRGYALSSKTKKIFDDVPISELEKGKSYTYVITEDGRMSFGMVDNGWEFGVKHLHIANGRPVVAAGELKINAAGKVDYNLLSGTFTRRIQSKFPDRSGSMKEKVEEVFSREVGSQNLRYVNDDVLLPAHSPKVGSDELIALCKSEYFKVLNSHFCE